MEEKERYKLESYNEAFCQIHDTESNEWYLRKDLVKDLLNQQDQKIKELKQQLHDLPKKIVEEIRTYCNLKEFNPEFVDKEHQKCIVSYTELIDFLDTILKKYGGEDE